MIPPRGKQGSKDILRALMDPNRDDVVAWSASDLRAILQHQLDTSLREEVGQLANAGECARESVLAAIETSGCSTFGDVLQLETPNMDLLRLVKNYAKSAIALHGSHLPSEVAKVLYIVSILRGSKPSHSPLTALDETSVEREARRALVYAWLPERVRQWIRDGLRELHGHADASAE